MKQGSAAAGEVGRWRIGAAELGHLRGRRRCRWRFRARPVDSSRGEEEEEVAELLSKSAELEAAPSSGGRWRLWRRAQLLGAFSRGNRESGQGGREKKGGFFVAFNNVFRR
jgi:hypothetical protein